LIRIEGLTKLYGKTQALDRLDLHVHDGEFFGFLGPNGAGKTTTIRILTTLTLANAGKAWIAGYEIGEQPLAAKKHTGVVPQSINLDQELSARENLEIHGLLYNMDSVERKRRIKEVLAETGLGERIDDPVRTFSGGMKRRLMIARALMHEPKVLFLDEPTVGLDASVKRNLWALLKQINRGGATILLTTHYIDEAENLCDRVGIIHKGKLIALDSPKNLIETTGRYVADVFRDDVMTTHFFESREQAGDFASAQSDSVMIRRCNLEDVFVKLTGEAVQPDRQIMTKLETSSPAGAQGHAHEASHASSGHGTSHGHGSGHGHSTQ
jgi:ABC-2 type transport system ATP-binding protein